MSDNPSDKFEQVEVEFDDVIVIRRRVKVYVKAGSSDVKAIKEARRDLKHTRDHLVDVARQSRGFDDNIKVVSAKPTNDGGHATKREQASFIAYEHEDQTYGDERKFFDVVGNGDVDGISRQAHVYECAGRPGLFRISIDQYDWNDRRPYGNGGSVLWGRDCNDYSRLRKLARDFVNRKFTPTAKDFTK